MPRYILFVGSDISTHILLNELAPAVMARGITPEIVQVREPEHAQPRQLESLEFYERTLPSRVIYPFLNKNAGALKSPKQLARSLGFNYRQIDDVNSDSFFFNIIAQPDIMGGTSIRSYQKFGKRIVDHLKENGFLWNLHPGDIPRYRGVLPPFRTLQNGEAHNTLSLHEVDYDYDTGPYIQKDVQTVDRSKSMFEHYLMLGPVMLNMITNALDEYLETGSVKTTEQTGEPRYYTYPNQQELNAAEARAIHLAPHPSLILDFYVSTFGNGDSNELRHALIQASAEFERIRQAIPEQSVPRVDQS